MQVKFVGVKFINGTRIYSFNPNNLKLKNDDFVIVETANGNDLGRIVTEEKEVSEEALKEDLKKVLRLATEKEVETAYNNQKKVKDFAPDIERLIKKHNLEMKIADITCNYDMSRIIISFTSSNRVDFRELVKELATTLKARIELRQIGARDEVKVLGGLGPCGRECCCTKFLDDFDHVSIKMAKVQGLSLNPVSISGQCGKLMCCLGYENEYYNEMYNKVPKVGSEVLTKDGKGLVIYNDLLKQEVTVKYINQDSSEIKVYKLDELNQEKNNGKN